MNHKKLLLLIFIPLLLSLVASNVNASTSKIYTLADSRVVHTTPNMNYGDNDVLDVSWDGMHERSFLRFSLSSIPSGSTISLVTLHLRTEHTDGGGIVAVYFVSDDGWGEMTITWNNQPSYSTLLDSIMVTDEYTWYSWTVTNQIKTEFSGDKTISFMLGNSTSSVPELTEYDSKDGQSGMCPYLEVTYEEKEEEYGGVDTTMIPNKIAGALNIPLFAGQILASAILFCLICFPIFYLTKRSIAHISAIFFSLSLTIALGWLPIWIFLILGVLIALMLAQERGLLGKSE
jgi:hypothetical protein